MSKIQNRSPNIEVYYCEKYSNKNFIPLPSSFQSIGNMHLWPSTRIRDSFKHGYIKKLEWNLHRMKIQKHQQQQSSSKQNLLDKEQASDVNAETAEKSNSVSFGQRVLEFCSEVLMLLSCCYCCYCCGVCLSEEEEH